MIYLDYSATTPVNQEVLDSFTKDSEILTGPLMIMLVMYIIISLVSSRIRDAVLKRKLQTDFWCPFCTTFLMQS